MKTSPLAPTAVAHAITMLYYQASPLTLFDKVEKAGNVDPCWERLQGQRLGD